ncbi:hypothetical protein EDB81DRAFT_257398 [Dactylonectria macrodidyma]|uniref:Uncharacterized protein n=1 Tax=Dactylonectria macrodidyma TaxID=307937 RepID=A0A9P9JF14_9HYPO|nr:hypothetical protein EDB81DRAFT_257398 [Dactylonectria macrodidyma]
MAGSLVLLTLAGAAAVAAQSTTVSLFLPMVDAQDLDASVVGVDSAKTTFAVTCPSGADSNDCGLTEAQTIIQGPSTFAMTYAYSDAEYGIYSEAIDCNMQPAKDLITCTVSVSQEFDATTIDTSSVASTSGYLELLAPVTVTAGANKLGGDSETASASGSETTAAAPASTGSTDTTATGSASGAVESASESVSASASESGSGSAASTPSATDNAAGTMITQNAVLAGAAVLVGGALLL